MKAGQQPPRQSQHKNSLQGSNASVTQATTSLNSSMITLQINRGKQHDMLMQSPAVIDPKQALTSINKIAQRVTKKGSKLLNGSEMRTLQAMSTPQRRIISTTADMKSKFNQKAMSPDTQEQTRMSVQMESYLAKGRMLQTIDPSVISAGNTSQKLLNSSAATIQEVSYETATKSGRKLFAQEFYNLGKKSQRRDLAGYSLHHHPDGYLDGIFSKKQINRGSNTQDRQSAAQKQREQSVNASRSQASRKRLLVQQSQLSAQQGIGDREMQKFNNVNTESQENVKIRSGMLDLHQNTKTIFQQPQQIRNSMNALEQTLPKIMASDLSQTGSILMQNNLQNLDRSTDLTTLNQEQNINKSGQNPQGSLNGINSQVLAGVRGSAQVLDGKLDHGLLSPLSGRESQGSPQERPYLMQASSSQAGERVSRFFSDEASKSPIQGSSYLQLQNKTKVPVAKPHPLNQKRLQRRQEQEDRVYNDLQLFKNIQRETYGTSHGTKPGKYNSGYQNGSQLRGNDKAMRQHVVKTNKSRVYDAAYYAENYQFRHPDLKHHQQEGAESLSISEQKLNTFAAQSPLFNQQAMSLEQIDIYDRMRTMDIPKFDISQPSAPSKIQKQQSRSSQPNQQQDQRKQSAQGSIQARVSQDESSDGSVPKYTNKNIKTGVSNIKDKKGFEKKIENKLEDMIDNQQVQIFNVEQSKYLYQQVTKEQHKERVWQNKQEMKSMKKNKQFMPLQQSQHESSHQTGDSKKSLNQRKFSAKRSSSKLLTADETNSQHAPHSPVQKGLNDTTSRKSSLQGSNEKLKQEDTHAASSPSRDTAKANSTHPVKQMRHHHIKHSSPKKSRATTQTRPDYFNMKGVVEIDVLRDNLERDLMFNMRMAEKMGVLTVLKDMHFDAESDMELRTRRRSVIAPTEESKGVSSTAREKNKGASEVAFPGYQEQLEKSERQLQLQQLAVSKRKIATSEEVIGTRSTFALNKDSKVDLLYIFKQFQRNGLKSFTRGMMEELVQKSEVVAFMTQIRAQRVKNDPHQIQGQERDLADYIKYLIGETHNTEFVLKREDFSQKHELNKKSLKMPFDEYADQEENSMKTVANDIIERVDYNTVVQRVSEPVSLVKYQSDPKYAYFQVCNKDSDLAIPLLAKVVNRQLSLMNYKLSLGHVKAFVRTFDFNKMFVTKFLFKNCGLTDEHNQILFSHMEKLEHVESIILKQEDFNVKSMAALRPILARPKPFQLQVLRIIDCRIPTQVTRELISTLRESNQLKVLGLVNTKISDASMQELGEIVAESKTLRELDVSWNVLRPQSYIALMLSLGANKTLKTLNLSWNRIVDPLETITDPPLDPFAETQQIQEIAGDAVAGQTLDSARPEIPFHEKLATFTEHSQAVVDNLTHLLKHNKNLQHVNLTNTGLTEYMMLQLGRALTRSKSLQSIHLCQNPGATPRVKDYLHKRIRAMPLEEVLKFSVTDAINKLTRTSTRKVLLRQLTMGREEHGDKPIARETIKLKQNMERKRIYSMVNELPTEEAADNRMIFTRILGHKQDMRGSGQWKMITDRNEECWICDQEVYGVVFWDADTIADKAYYSTERFHQVKVFRSVISKLHEYRSKEEEDRVASENPTSPIIMGDFTNWKPKPFFDVTEYTEAINPQFDHDAIVQQMHFDKILKYSKSEMWQFDAEDKLNYQRYTGDFFEQHATQNWKTTLSKHLLYKKPHLIYGADTRDDFYKNLHMMFAMFKVGKHDYIIRTPEKVYDRESCEYVDTRKPGEQPDYMYFTNVSDIRVEETHPYLKISNSKRFVRTFNKEKSVFAPWKEDTKRMLDQAFQLDWDNTKITKFVKNQADLEQLKEYLESNYQFIKECYLELQYNSVYPFVNKIELASFCEKAKLIDDRLNMANCDLLFVQCFTNQSGIKAKTGLIRCEFLEYLVRLANFKYLQTGAAATFLDATKIVIDKYLKANITPLPWQQFRDEELWTIDVNDVFDNNLDGIQKLHHFYFTPTQKKMSDKDVINLFSKDAFTELSQVQSKYCLAYAKMTIKDEIKDFEQYRTVQPVELIEMIGRAAKVKYLHTDHEEEPLARRIEMILDQVFPLIKFRRREVVRDAESESASDDDY